MNTTNKKAYIYKMNLVPANVLCTIIFVVTYIVTVLINPNLAFGKIKMNMLVIFILIILYLGLHEFLHGVGYFVGGCKRKNIQYGICLEKGIFYAMAYQELTKKNILISLQMPFTVIGVITYIISFIFNMPLLNFLSLINICGASMDLAMFMYISRLGKITYSESGQPDEFVLISDNDLNKKKSIFFRIVDEKKYKKEDYVFPKQKKIVISRTSIIMIILFILLGVITSII